MNFTGINLITLKPTTPYVSAATWQRESSRAQHRVFNGLHLSPRLEKEVSACEPRRAQVLADLPVQVAAAQAEPVPETVTPATVVKPVMRKGMMVAVRQALLQLGKTPTEIAELTHTDRRSAHKHANATPSSKVKPWLSRSEAEQAEALKLARELMS